MPRREVYLVAGYQSIDQEHILLGLVMDEGQFGAMLSRPESGSRHIERLQRIGEILKEYFQRE